MKTVLQPETVGDARLVELCLQQDREAFGTIVARYQSLICSIAYSACGDVGRSEDLAQDTFITAWKKLGDLKEPARLKAWLCGIVRNLTQNVLRREGRAQTEPLDEELCGTEGDPHEQAVSREEEALVWKALEAMPAEYREPMVLFYREGQSTQTVAEALDLTEDAVSQRLSRGRKMLKENVADTVESALGRSAPGRAFTTAVVAALPVAFATPAKAAGLAAVVAKGSIVAASVFTAANLSAWIGGFVGNFFVWKEQIANTKSPRERSFEIRQVWMMVALTALTMATVILGTHYYLHHGSAGNPLARDLVVAGGFYGLAVYTVLHAAYWQRRKRRIQVEDGTFVPEEWVIAATPDTVHPFDGGPLKKFRWITRVCALVYVAQMASTGHWRGAAALVAMGIAIPLLARREQKRRARFLSAQSLVSSLTTQMSIIALLTPGPALFNYDLAKGSLGFPALSAAAIGFNAAVITGYGLLWAFLVWRYRTG
jgi:RNA polymerase sigma factor (sigma-70 family)